MKFMGRLFQFVSVLWFGFGAYILIQQDAVEELSWAIRHQDWLLFIGVILISFLLVGLPVIFVFFGESMARSGKLKKQNRELKKQLEELTQNGVCAPAAAVDFEAVRQTAPVEVSASTAAADPRTEEKERARAQRREKLSRAAKDASEKAKVLGDAVKTSGTITGTSNYSVIAGALFAVLAIILGFDLLMVLRAIGGLSSILKQLPGCLVIVVYLALYVVAAAQLLKKKTDGRFVAVLGAFAVLSVLSFVAGFFTKSYVAWYYSYRNERYRFNLFCTLPVLAELVGYVSLFALAVIHGTDYAPRFREKTKTLWFFPAACLLAGFLLPILFTLMKAIGLIRWVWTKDIWNIGTWFGTAVRIAAILFAGMWITNPEGLPEAEVKPEDMCRENSLPGAAYYDLFKHTLFMMITFGIYTMMWIYRTTRNLNNVEGETPRTPWKKLLLCVFIPFYLPYWVYKSAQRVDKLAEAAKVPGRMEAVCLIMGFFVPPIAFILLQDTMNRILKAHANIHQEETLQTTPAQELPEQ